MIRNTMGSRPPIELQLVNLALVRPKASFPPPYPTSTQTPRLLSAGKKKRKKLNPAKKTVGASRGRSLPTRQGGQCFRAFKRSNGPGYDNFKSHNPVRGLRYRSSDRILSDAVMGGKNSEAVVETSKCEREIVFPPLLTLFVMID